MARLADYPRSAVGDLRDRLQRLLAQAPHLQGACQLLVSSLYSEFHDSLVLARAYATVPLRLLPQKDRAFVSALAGTSSALGDNTPILSLLGTSGARLEWQDRYRSQGHLGIPLLSSEFVASIPMVSRLMRDMGLGLEWLDTRSTDIVVKRLGSMAGVFYVEDARTTVDEAGRKVVPAQDFVAANGVRTVFGLGGCYVNGCFLTIILFTREALDRHQVGKFMPLVNTVKTATMDVAMRNRIYA